MNADRLLAHYERIADAPDAIARLRRFILDLAVRGKLVEQDPNDESASELLERIVAEKARRLKAGEIKKQSALPPVAPSEEPFSVPNVWEWTRIGSAAYVEMGQSPPSEHYNRAGHGIPFFQGKADFGKRYPTARYWCTQPKKHAAQGDILISVRAPVGPTNVASEPCCIGRGLAALRSHNGIDRNFLLRCLEAFEHELAALGFGTTFIAINKNQLTGFVIPLPPLAEQHRIVAKVDELMALCDRLEAARTEREATRGRMAAASLVRLNDPDPDTVVFRNHAAFALENLTPLTTRRDQIKALRQTILNLAVRGKLVPQDPNDESASELLKRIAAEKARLVREKKIRARRARMSEICSDIPFDMPAGWNPAKIEQIIVEIQTGPFGSSLHQSDYQLGGTPVINPASIQNERIIPIEKMAVGPVTLERLSSFKLQTGDVIMGRRGEMGRCAVVSECERGWLCGTGSLILRTLEYVYPRFLSMLIGSPFSRKYLGGTAVGTTMQNLNQTILLNLSFGIPPLAEQHRIVAKVSELMALCDQLEASVANGDGTRGRFLDALLHEALAPSTEKIQQDIAMIAETVPDKPSGSPKVLTEQTTTGRSPG